MLVASYLILFSCGGDACMLDYLPVVQCCEEEGRASGEAEQPAVHALRVQPTAPARVQTENGGVQ